MSTNTTPANATAHARAWWNANKPEGERLAERGTVPAEVVIEWTLAGMPESDQVKAKAVSSNGGPTFAKGELTLYRAWADENGKDSSLAETKAAWFTAGKPEPKFYGDNAQVAVISARKINKDGMLSKAPAKDFFVTRGELNAIRGDHKGKSPAIHYVAAIADQLEGHAPIRILTRNTRGEDSTVFHANTETFDDGSERTVEGWTQESTGKSIRQQKIEKDREVDQLKAQLAEMQAKMEELLAGKSAE